ncbi:MAG: FAD:protein FMN transferase [Cyclobacteriaceae bacterium]
MQEARRKNIIYSLILLGSIAMVWLYRNYFSPPPVQEKVAITGTTMGTTYSIKYLNDEGLNLKSSLDSLLEVYNQSLSTYIPNSEISQFNNNTLIKFELPYFYPVLEASKEVYEKTGGAFDPTVMPLVNAWGFGPADQAIPDSTRVDSLRSLVSFDSLFYDSVSICKLKEGVQLDFSAIAKGNAVDVVADFLKGKGLKDMFVEIGGEIAAYGNNETGNRWAVYIEKPLKDSLQAIATVKLDNKAIATSGNYRNFYTKEGKKYAHTISPFTGYPVEHSLLSASVFADNCTTADAYATAFMVVGLEGAQKILAENPEIEAYLIYSDEEGALKSYVTPGIEPDIVN